MTPKILRCKECKTILAEHEFKAGFCVNCDPAICSPLDIDYHTHEPTIKELKASLLRDKK